MLLGLAAVAAVLVAGSVAMPRTTLLLAAAAVALVFLVTRIDLAILLVVATANPPPSGNSRSLNANTYSRRMPIRNCGAALRTSNGGNT